MCSPWAVTSVAALTRGLTRAKSLTGPTGRTSTGGDVEDAHELLRTRRWPNATGKAPISHDENLKGELAMMLQRWRTPTDKDVLTAKRALEHLEHLDEIA